MKFAFQKKKNGEFTMTISKNLRALRAANRLSQAELAKKINVSRNIIGRWESGESIPTIENIIKLTTLFEVTIDEFANSVTGLSEQMACKE